MQRKATLLPNPHYNNRSMFDTWPRDLGCQWRDSLDGLHVDLTDLDSRLWKRLAAPRLPELFSWQARPRRSESWELKTGDNEAALHSQKGRIVPLQTTAASVWAYCDGSVTVEQSCNALFAHFSNRTRFTVAREVRNALLSLRRWGP